MLVPHQIPNLRRAGIEPILGSNNLPVSERIDSGTAVNHAFPSRNAHRPFVARVFHSFWRKVKT